jgi:hypothetical protein
MTAADHPSGHARGTKDLWPKRESATRWGAHRVSRTDTRGSMPTSSLRGQSRARTRFSPCSLVLAALLVGAVGARVALAPSRSDAVGALAATVETWIISGRGGRALARYRSRSSQRSARWLLPASAPGG